MTYNILRKPLSNTAIFFNGNVDKHLYYRLSRMFIVQKKKKIILGEEHSWDHAVNL